MAKEVVPAKTQDRSTREATRLKQFKAPETIAAEFGMMTNTEDHISGVVATEHVRELLDAFGLQERTSVVFPFQHIKKQHGEIWSMRIEPPAAHTIDGKPVMGHQWVYMRQLPESVGAAA